MSFIAVYNFFKKNEMRQTLYGLVITALVMTIFEIIFAYKIVFPGIRNSLINTLYDKFVKEGEIDENSETSLFGELKALAYTVDARENLKLEKINLHSKIFAGTLIFVLLALVISYNRSLPSSMRTEPQIYSLITICFLIFFQYSFYIFSTTKYKFTHITTLLPQIVRSACPVTGDNAITSRIPDNKKLKVLRELNELQSNENTGEILNFVDKNQNVLGATVDAIQAFESSRSNNDSLFETAFEIADIYKKSTDSTQSSESTNSTQSNGSTTQSNGSTTQSNGSSNSDRFNILQYII